LFILHALYLYTSFQSSRAVS